MGKRKKSGAKKAPKITERAATEKPAVKKPGKSVPTPKEYPMMLYTKAGASRIAQDADDEKAARADGFMGYFESLAE